jgi:spoIIIJ-associated protein
MSITGVEEPHDTASGGGDALQNISAVSGETVAARAKKITEDILARMKLDFPVTVDETPEFITLKIEGDGNGLLIGKRGQTLDAIQTIVNIAVNKHGKDRKRIVIDTEGYRKRKTESLIALAERLGRKVKTTNKPVTVSNLSSHDRRVIHMALQTDRSLITKSKGEGAYRKIIILPARKEWD